MTIEFGTESCGLFIPLIYGYKHYRRTRDYPKAKSIIELENRYLMGIGRARDERHEHYRSSVAPLLWEYLEEGSTTRYRFPVARQQCMGPYLRVWLGEPAVGIV